MKKQLKAIWGFLTSNRLKTFYWTTLNGFIVIIGLGLADIDWIYAPIVIALLGGITKFINRDVLGSKK